MNSPWMNPREAALYLRFVDDKGKPKLEAFGQFVRGEPTVRIYALGGGPGHFRAKLRYRKEDLDALLTRIK